MIAICIEGAKRAEKDRERRGKRGEKENVNSSISKHGGNLVMETTGGALKGITESRRSPQTVFGERMGIWLETGRAWQSKEKACEGSSREGSGRVTVERQWPPSVSPASSRSGRLFTDLNTFDNSTLNVPRRDDLLSPLGLPDRLGRRSLDRAGSGRNSDGFIDFEGGGRGNRDVALGLSPVSPRSPA